MSGPGTESFGVRVRRWFGRRATEARMQDEMRFHLEMEAERLVREEGLGADEARRRARVAFGEMDRYQEQMREGRGHAWFRGLSLDLKLGARMLVKYPVLTLAGVLALSVAVALAASWFEFMTDMVRPRIPLRDADRIVMIRTHDLEAAGAEPRSLFDFETWRAEVESIEELSAASLQDFNVTAQDGRFATLRGARLTPSGFRVAGETPLLGRTLVDADDEPSADDVVVIGYAVWQRLFDRDPSVIGQPVRIGSAYATVIGVMREGFGFPSNQEIWAPLRERASTYGPRQGPPIRVFGRLAPGVSLRRAQAELETIGERAAVAFPATHARLQPEVGRAYRGNDMAAAAAVINLPFLLFLIAVSANVATLLFARTASRGSEIALRSAIGASRRRIVVQLVAEALTLTLLAASLGLVIAGWGLRAGMALFWDVQQQTPPFYFDAGLSATTAVYVFGLAVLGAIIIGGLPGLRATRHTLFHRIAQPGAGGSGIRFGAVATGVIVIQVALSVAFVPVAILQGRQLLPERQDTDFPANAFLSGRLTLQSDSRAAADGALVEQPASGSNSVFDEAHRRFAAEPGVLAATRASRLPGFNHPVEGVQFEGDSTRAVGARSLGVDADFFEVVGARIADGRAFRPEDAAAGIDIAIVEASWALEHFGGRNPVGVRFRYPRRLGEAGQRWYEIVGVVAGIDRAVGPGERVALFHPLRPEERASLQIYLRTSGLPDELVPQVHSIVSSVDPRLGMTDLKPLDEVWAPVERSDVFFATTLAVIAFIIVFFALIGIYAMMSFTVAQRAREIGIRAALGANPRRIIASIFSRALGQVALGVVAGATLVSLTVARSPEGLRLVGAVAAAMVAVGLVGCLSPALRALRIPPTEALRAE